LSKKETGQNHPVRVALVAGTLGKGGAEKQLVYLARALKQAGIQVQIYCLSQGEFYEQALVESGLAPVWVGQPGNPVLRVLEIWRKARSFRPQIVQSAHFYTNLYAALAARLLNALSIGAIRSGMNAELHANGRWSRWLVRLPSALIANSQPARENALRTGYPGERIDVLPNVIDLADFDRSTGQKRVPAVPVTGESAIRVVLVARLVPEKRVDRFLRVMALAREQEPRVRGLIVGDGPLRAQLEEQAARLELLPGGIEFLGERHDVPAILNQGHILVLTSEVEGFPNAILEGMAACLPVITTPAGESGSVVEEGQTGYVVPLEDEALFARRIVELARQPELRAQFGLAGRRRVERLYSFESLAGRLLNIYRQFANRQKMPGLVRLLEEKE
jgi:glycosyltransferase involved in cell wall biosynthesis